MNADTTALLRDVHQARSFGPDPVPAAALADILETARWTGSSGGRQAWGLLVVQDRATLARLGELLPEARFVAEAPLAILVSMPGDKTALDAFEEGRLVERLLVAAAAHGLVSALGWVVGDARPAVASLLGVPSERLVRSIVAIGKPAAGADQAPGRSRRPLAELLHTERW